MERAGGRGKEKLVSEKTDKKKGKGASDFVLPVRMND